MTHETYEQRSQIDNNALDVEWLEQPRKFVEISRESAHINAQYDRAKENIDVLKAEIGTRIRKDPEKYGIEKITEVQVSSAITLDTEFHKAQMDLIDLKEQVAIVAGAVKAFDQRKKALENLVTLYGQEYFAGPKSPRNLDLERVRESHTREARDKMKGGKESDKKINQPTTRRRTK